MKHAFPFAVLFLCLTGTLPTCGAASSPIEQKSAKLLEQWQQRLDDEGLHAVVSGPFVIAGDGSAAQIEAYRDRTIVPAARALSAQFFQKAPEEPILILLFESEKPYKRLAKKWFDDDDVPHYGFYRHADRVIVMNVATGTGTLVHELTHALIAPDFPTVPDWFNEGLASLYEQSQFGENNEIRGLPNWRLPALQKAIEENKLRSLSELIQDRQFRDVKRVGINYAEARYLMFYLQEKGLLKQYYVEFRDHAAADPDGLASLKKVIAPTSLDAFEADWRKWVMTLRF